MMNTSNNVSALSAFTVLLITVLCTVMTACRIEEPILPSEEEQHGEQ